MDELRAPPLERSEVETFDDGKLLEEDVPLRDRRLPEDAQTAVVDGERLGSIGAMRGKVGPVDHPADRPDRGREAVAELAAIERVGAVASDRSECRREVGLLEHLAGTSPSAARTKELRRLLVTR